MRPAILPSGILASSARGGGSAAKPGPPSSSPMRAAAVVMRFIGALLSRAGGFFPDVDLVQRGAQAFGLLQRVVVGPEVQEEHARLLGQHVAVHGRDLD